MGQQQIEAQPKWTAPGYGVTHLQGLKRQFQVTAVDYGSFALCKVFTPGCGFSASETKHDSIEVAKAHGEQQAVALDGFAEQRS